MLKFPKKLNSLIIFLFCFLSTVAEEENKSNYYFTVIDGESGLSQNDVKSIIQDSWGFMWFGCRNRLNRYDGISIKVFDCYDAALNKRNNNIGALFEDKNKKLWVGTDKGVFIFDPVLEKFSFFNDSTSNGIRMEDWVADIQTDQDNNIWIVIPNQGLFRYDLFQKKLCHYQFGDSQRPDRGSPQSICIEPHGKIWIGSNGRGVFLYNKSSDSFTQFLGNKNGDSLENENIYTLCDYGDELIVGIHEGKLRKLNKRKNMLSDVDAPEVHYKIIRHVVCFDSEIWVGTDAGLYIIDELKDKVTHVHEDLMFDHALSDNRIEKIYKDKENGIWIGTHFGGVNYLPNRGASFELYVPLSNPNSLNGKRIGCLKEDSSGNIWIATENAGLDRFNPKTNTFQHIGKATGTPLSYDKVINIFLDKDQVWVGLFKNGMDVIQLPSFKVTHYSAETMGLNEASVFAVCEDRDGRIWLGNAWGVFTGNREEKKFTRMSAFGFSFIYDIMEDSEGYIWVATMGNGVFKHNQGTNITEHYLNDIKNNKSLSSNSVSNVTEDGKGNIWFSTDRGGICMYDKETKDFTTYSIAEGLPDDVAYKILEDKQQNLWFGTNKGLVKFNPQTKDIRVFTKNDGLPGNQFNYNSALASGSGKFYFGGLDGMIGFNPYELRENIFIPPVYISKLTISNKEIGIDSENSPLKKSITHTQKITLQYNQSNIAFDFVALSYTAPLANKYAYKMEGIDNDWTYTNNNHSASYAKLPPGKYTFKVKGTNNDGLWNEKGTSIDIEIQPPWWRSKFAYVIYIALLITLVYYWFYWYKRKSERRNTEKQRLFETEKERELYSAKVKFFTDIAHEIRTPLTLINGPLESLQELNITDPEIKKNIHIMERNTSQLLNLINQLLDFRKVDSNKLTLNFVRMNISDVIKDIFMQFEPMALRRKKKLQLHLPDDPLFAPVDRDEFSKILNNLFSNAVKYSSTTVDIVLTKKEQSFVIEVQNDGEPIPAEFHEKIFEPFYQLKKDENAASSSGIGLSLVRSLTELHNGKILVDTSSGFNNFILELPFDQKDVASEYERDFDTDKFIIEEKQGKSNFETVLVVEDNLEMLSFVADKLRDYFIVEKAFSVEVALEILKEKNVDIIVTDVMMPDMDGFQFCRQLKLDIEYNHIPIVLLTAKNDLASKIQGLEMGAEAYIEKPFSVNFLITQLTTLLNNRKREREAFMQKPFLPVQQLGMNKADEKFMDKMNEIIREHITDSDFNVERLAEILCMSRSSLHRKIKALSGLTTNDFIRLIRLKRAAELIAEGEYRIGEVCYLVGINSPSYFIKLFCKQFKMTPKEFEKQQHGITGFPMN